MTGAASLNNEKRPLQRTAPMIICFCAPKVVMAHEPVRMQRRLRSCRLIILISGDDLADPHVQGLAGSMRRVPR